MGAAFSAASPNSPTAHKSNPCEAGGQPTFSRFEAFAKAVFSNVLVRVGRKSFADDLLRARKNLHLAIQGLEAAKNDMSLAETSSQLRPPPPPPRQSTRPND